MPDDRYANLPPLRPCRRALRNGGTSAEAALWNLLKKRRLGGRKFRRQHSVGRYVLDFYCPAERLAVELDGAHHFTPAGQERDVRRTRYLNTLGIRVVRFENRRVFEAPEAVLAGIAAAFAD